MNFDPGNPTLSDPSGCWGDPRGIARGVPAPCQPKHGRARTSCTSRGISASGCGIKPPFFPPIHGNYFWRTCCNALRTNLDGNKAPFLALSPCLPFFFFFSFLSCCSFGTDFNSPSDRFGIHKPLSTLLETLSPRDDEALQGMMITAAHHFLL